MQITHERAFVDVLLWNTEDEIAGTFAVEILMVNELCLTIGIEQFNSVDELQVRSEHRDQFAS